jgi:hypothetical protein
MTQPNLLSDREQQRLDHTNKQAITDLWRATGQNPPPQPQLHLPAAFSQEPNALPRKQVTSTQQDPVVQRVLANIQQQIDRGELPPTAGFGTPWENVVTRLRAAHTLQQYEAGRFGNTVPAGSGITDDTPLMVIPLAPATDSKGTRQRRAARRQRKLSKTQRARLRRKEEALDRRAAALDEERAMLHQVKQIEHKSRKALRRRRAAARAAGHTLDESLLEGYEPKDLDAWRSQQLEQAEFFDDYVDALASGDETRIKEIETAAEQMLALHRPCSLATQEQCMLQIGDVRAKQQKALYPRNADHGVCYWDASVRMCMPQSVKGNDQLHAEVMAKAFETNYHVHWFLRELALNPFTHGLDVLFLGQLLECIQAAAHPDINLNTVLAHTPALRKRFVSWCSERIPNSNNECTAGERAAKDSVCEVIQKTGKLTGYLYSGTCGYDGETNATWLNFFGQGVRRTLGSVLPPETVSAVLQWLSNLMGPLTVAFGFGLQLYFLGPIVFKGGAIAGGLTTAAGTMFTAIQVGDWDTLRSKLRTLNVKNILIGLFLFINGTISTLGSVTGLSVHGITSLSAIASAIIAWLKAIPGLVWITSGLTSLVSGVGALSSGWFAAVAALVLAMLWIGYKMFGPELTFGPQQMQSTTNMVSLAALYSSRYSNSKYAGNIDITKPQDVAKDLSKYAFSEYKKVVKIIYSSDSKKADELLNLYKYNKKQQSGQFSMTTTRLLSACKTVLGANAGKLTPHNMQRLMERLMPEGDFLSVECEQLMQKVGAEITDQIVDTVIDANALKAMAREEGES